MENHNHCCCFTLILNTNRTILLIFLSIAVLILPSQLNLSAYVMSRKKWHSTFLNFKSTLDPYLYVKITFKGVNSLWCVVSTERTLCTWEGFSMALWALCGFIGEVYISQTFQQEPWDLKWWKVGIALFWTIYLWLSGFGVLVTTWAPLLFLEITVSSVWPLQWSVCFP